MPSRIPPVRLTRSHLAKIHRDVEKMPSQSALTPLTEADFEDYAAEMLAQNHGREFWVFAYGSLIWKPAFEFVESRFCSVPGWRRSYCLNIRNWRATPEVPGLMLALDRGGSCKGVAFRMPPDTPHERMVRLLRRETDFHEDKIWQRWLTVRSGGDTFRALGFWCAPSQPDPDLLRLTEQEQAQRLARAVGHVGSCAEYLLNTVEHLEQLGLHDSYLWRMQDLVAREIETMPG